MSDSRLYTRSRATTSFVGMAIFMGGWSMMLLALLFAYADVRLQASTWPPAGEPLPPRDLPSLATLVLLGASLMLERARRQPRPKLGAPIALALVFLGLQMIVWLQLQRAGLHASSTFGSVFWTLTIFHGLHIAIAIIGLGVTYAYTRSDQHFQTRLRNWAIFWHGLFVAWILIFVGVYLV
jgi:heme/copper-type cytochrome/quinol oxidase subunit 3